MPPLLLDDDEAIAIAVGLRTAARASVTGIEETSVRALVKLEQVLPAHLRRRVARARVGDGRASRRGSDRRPAAPDRDRRCLPRLASACASPTAAATAPRAGARSSPLARQPRPALVPAGLGPRSRGLADVPGRSPRRARRRRERASRRAAAGARRGRVRRRSSIARAPTRYEARVTLHASEPTSSAVARLPLGRERRADRRSTAASFRTRRRRPRLARDADRDARGRLRRDEPPELAQQFRALAARLQRAAI